MIETLRVAGDFRGSTGYDRLTRAFVREFVRLGVQVELVPLPGLAMPARRVVADSELFDSLTRPVEPDTVLHIGMPMRVIPEPGRVNVNYTQFEMSRIPAAWVELAKPHDLVVVPTECAREAWTGSGVPAAKLRVSPQGVDAQFFSRPVDSLALTDATGRPLSSYGVRVLNVAEVTLRKNQIGLIRAWLRATRPDDDAVLIVKGTAGRGRAWTDFYADLRDMLDSTALSLERAAPVCIIPDLLSEEDLRRLYQSCTHYVSLSHGEGWDLAMMEAAVSGLRLIAPAHTAYLEYLDHECAHLIPAALSPMVYEGSARPEILPHYEGLCWWEPDEDAAVELLRAVARGEEGLRASPRARIAFSYSWEQAAHRLLAILDARE